MTDKEKYEALVAEIKRLKDETAIGLNERENGVENGRMQVIFALEAKVNSMDEEPTCDDLEKVILAEFNSFVGKHGEFDKTYIDGMAKAAAVLCGKAGANWQKQQMMNGAFVYEKKHDTAMVLASECLRNHGWFGREHDFNDLWQFICGVKELFSGEFRPNDKVKIIAIKEDKQ